MLAWLDRDAPFPPAETALRDPPGLLAVGGELTLARLRLAYRNGIFPWYTEGEPILWWSLDPRLLLACEDFHASHSLRKRLRAIARHEDDVTPSVQIRVDTAFAQVMRACGAPRSGETGTWITPAMQAAYCAWHRAGEVHSVETWINGQLAGGLYGVSLGAMFCGESMFARATDASKIALAYLVRFLLRHGVTHIDCQQNTPHLVSLGARPVSRAEFLKQLRVCATQKPPPWEPGWLDAQGSLHPFAPL